jgi:hypothetical protein
LNALALSTQARRPRPPRALRRSARRNENSQPLGGLARHDQRLARLVMAGDAFAHGGEQALGRLADQHEIDAVLGGADDRARHAGNKPRRPHAGIEIENKAQLDLRHDLGVVGIAHARQAAGAEQDGVGLFAQLDRRFRHRLAGLAIMVGAGGSLGETEFEARRCGLDMAQDLERGRHHLGPNAVSGQDGDMEGGVGGRWDRFRGGVDKGMGNEYFRARK